MNDIDRKIREALQEQDSELLDAYRGEQSIQEMVAGLFRSRHRWLMWMTGCCIVAMFAAAVSFGWQFAHAETDGAKIGWAMGIVLTFNSIGALKTWWWMEINKNTVIREVKRLELEFANFVHQTRQLSR